MKSFNAHFEHDYVEIASETIMATVVIGLAIFASVVAVTMVIGL